MSDFNAKIDSVEKQKGACENELMGVEKTVSVKNEELSQLKIEEESIRQKMKKIGFFKFKERKPFKEELRMVCLKITECENLINDEKQKIENMSQQIINFQKEIENLQRQKIEHEKEQELLKLAASGDSNAQFEAGKILIKKDYTQAILWLNKAIAQGHSGAKYFLEENRKYFFFFLFNDTAWNIVEISGIYNGGNNIFPTKQVIIPPTTEGGAYDNILVYSIPQEFCVLDYSGNIELKIHYQCQVNNMVLPAIKEEKIYHPGFMTQKEAEENFESNSHQGNKYLIYSRYMKYINLDQEYF